MNIYDKAHELAKALSESDEYKEFKKAKEEIKKDEKAKEMLKDLREKELEVQALALSGKPYSEEEKKLRNLYEIISYHSGIRKYIEAENRLMVLISDIQKIIFKAIDTSLED